MILITPLVKGLTLLPLQAASVETSSRAFHLMRRDVKAVVFSLIWISFALFSFFVALYGANWLFALWFVWLGLSIDALYLHGITVTGYADPYQLLRTFQSQGKKAYADDRLTELCESIDSIGEISLKAVYQKSLPLSAEGVKGLERLADDYFQKKPLGESGSASTMLGFLLHRLKMVFDQAVEDRLEPLASQIILSTGKIALYVGRTDMEMTSLPLHFLEKFLDAADDYELHEVVVNSSIVLSEIAKSALEDDQLKGKEMAPLLMGLTEQMEKAAKETFREDKNIPMFILTDPFKEIKTMIESHDSPPADAAAITSDLERILVEFQALESVLKSVPNIPGYSDS